MLPADPTRRRGVGVAAHLLCTAGRRRLSDRAHRAGARVLADGRTDGRHRPRGRGVGDAGGRAGGSTRRRPGPPLPVVFAFHGAYGSGQAVRARLGTRGGGGWRRHLRLPQRRPGDLGHRTRARSMVGGSTCFSGSCRRTTASIRTRISITGFSAGAVFTLYLGCNVPHTFHAPGRGGGDEQPIRQSAAARTPSRDSSSTARLTRPSLSSRGRPHVTRSSTATLATESGSRWTRTASVTAARARWP